MKCNSLALRSDILCISGVIERKEDSIKIKKYFNFKN